MDAAAEARHRPPRPAPAGWVERWGFEWATPDARQGGFVELALHPGRRCSYVAGLVEDDRPYLLVRDDELDAPPAAGPLEVRGSLWAACTCEAPLSHWVCGLESFAVTFDPADRADLLGAWGREWGGRTGLGLDLEWEDAGGTELRIDEGYARWGRVDGEVLTGAGDHVRTVSVADARGVRWHAWGVPRATGRGWSCDRAGSYRVWEAGEVLPRDHDGLPLGDGLLATRHLAPHLAPGPARERVGRLLGQGPEGQVGWAGCTYPPQERRE